MKPQNFISQLRLPIIQSPMFIVSNARLVIASSKAGIVGSFPSANCRTLEALDQTFSEITQALGSGKEALPWAVNLIVSKMYARSNDDLDLILKHQPPIVITSLGNPKEVVEKVHKYGGLVFSDVINLYHSKKAIDAGVDGLILVCNGAGGHTGELSPFAFVSEVREIFDGTIIVGGKTGAFSGFMMQRGRMIICGDAGMNLGDSMYDGTIYVGGEVEELGVDCVPGEMTELDIRYLSEKLAIYGIKTPKGVEKMKKYVSGKMLWNYASLEPNEKKLIL